MNKKYCILILTFGLTLLAGCTQASAIEHNDDSFSSVSDNILINQIEEKVNSVDKDVVIEDIVKEEFENISPIEENYIEEEFDGTYTGPYDPELNNNLKYLDFGRYYHENGENNGEN